MDDLLKVDPAEHIRFFAGSQSRYTGYAGCVRAEEYIKDKFREIGLASVEEAPFQVVIPRAPEHSLWSKSALRSEQEEGRPEHGATLSVGGRRIPLYCVMPNSVRTSMTEPEGIGGQLIWADEGYLSDFNGKPVQGSVVLMKFNSVTRWLNAAKLGAGAIIFVGPDHPFRNDAEQKYSALPVPVPRYYLPRSGLPALAAALSGKSADQFDIESALAAISRLGGPDEPAVQVNVRAQVAWEEATVKRVSGEIPGTDPQLAGQTLVVWAYYDSTSVVPALSPGAESSCGIATLLEVAKFLRRHPPRRNVKFIAAPGHYQGLGGVRDYALKTIYPRRWDADKDADEGTGEPYFFVGLDISARHDSFGAFYKGYFYDQLGTGEVELQRAYSDYSALLMDWGSAVGAKGGPAAGLTYQSGIVPQQGRNWRSLQPGLIAFDSEVISLCGYPAITLATTGDPRNSLKTPLDTYERLKPYMENVRRQAIACTYIIKKTADVPVLPINRGVVWAKREAASVFGQAVEFSQLSFMPRSPVANGVITASLLDSELGSKSKSMMGVQTYEVKLSNLQGYFELFGLKRDKQLKIDAFELSRTSGVVWKVAKSDPVLVKATNRRRADEWGDRETDCRLNFFRAASVTVYDLEDPLSLRTLGKTNAVRGDSNSDLQYLVSFVGQESGSDQFSKPFAVFFTKRDKRVKILLAYSDAGFEGLLLNFPKAGEAQDQGKKERTGIGYKLDKNENFIYRTAFQIAQDMHRFDGYRLDRLKRSGIAKKAVRDLFDQVGAHLSAANRALADNQYDNFYFHANMAWSLENRVYPDVRDTATDVMKGLIFYFALLLPFVLFTERLLFNVVEIRRKLAIIAGLFGVSYLVLALVHPAFQLSQMPVIILNGFVMLVAALGTIWYLLTKFQTEMERIRQKLDMIHRADVARTSAAMAAFTLGISNMRKRKVRTGLTAVTLILLTFTILSFTSFEAIPAQMMDYEATRKAPYEGVLVRGLNWSQLSESVTYDILNFFRVKGMRTAPRSWFVSPQKTQELQLQVHRADGRPGMAVASAILGLSPEEKYFSNFGPEKFLEYGWFDRSAPDWPFVCILPRRMQESLRIEDSEVGKAKISVLGRRLRVIGVADSGEWFKYEDLDGEEITPVDFVAQQFKEGGAGQQTTADSALTATGDIDAADFVHRRSSKKQEQQEYIHMEPDRVLVIPNELNVRLGATVRAIAAGPGQTTQAQRVLKPFQRVLKQLLSRVDLALYSGYSDKLEAGPHIHRVATRGRLSMGGMKGLIIPIIIAALIVFNTMLGSVYERVTEIKTYASVGLAPMHIGALFLAESCVFAVVGAMLGYILGQVLSKILVHMPLLMQGISLNYSSISAVWSAVLVVLVVLASTIYPARMAGKLSVPDETRKMSIPEPTTDVWEIWFPFTVSSKEALGVMSYLREYFESNDEDAIGRFTADNIRFYTGEYEGRHTVCVEADVWVAPLDMGVSQRVKIASVPDPEEGDITYLLFTITRKSGEFQTWHRMNTGFLKDLRKQLLIWRLVTPEAKKRLTREGVELLERQQDAAAD
ncbi:MAG: M28 family peptidase [Planctomycetes bacterium]|nr:M28 family peptidase [Planctomycetota bacterium]